MATAPGVAGRASLNSNVFSSSLRSAQGDRRAFGWVSRFTPSQSRRTMRDRYCCSVALARKTSGLSSRRSDCTESPRRFSTVESTAAAVARIASATATMWTSPGSRAPCTGVHSGGERAHTQGGRQPVRQAAVAGRTAEETACDSGGCARVRLRGRDAVAAGVFRFVQGGVRFLDQPGHVGGVVPEARHADRHGHTQRSTARGRRERRGRHRAPQLLGDLDRLLASDARQHHHELVAAVAGHHVHLADVPLERHGDAAQHRVADGVPVGVVDLLEQVQVHHQDGQLVAEPQAARQLLLEAREQVAAVGDAGERVRERQVAGLLVEARVGDGQAGLGGEGLREPDFLGREPVHGRPVQVHHAHDAALRAQRDAEERAGRPAQPLVVEVLRIPLHVGHVDGLPLRRRRAAHAFAETEAHPARRGEPLADDGLDDQLVRGLLEQQGAELLDAQGRAHQPPELLELLGKIERAAERLGSVEQELHLAHVGGEARVHRAELALQGQLAPQGLQRLLGLDLVRRHVGDAREHGVEGARQPAQLVVAGHLRAHQDVAHLGARHGRAEVLRRLDQEPARSDRHRDPGEGQRQQAAEDRALLEHVEGEDRVGPRHVLGVGDQRTQPHQQDHGGGDCGSEDQLQRDRAADAGEHFLILPSAPRRASRGVRNVADRALESCAPYPPGRGSRPVRRVLTALLLFALPAAAEEIRIELSRGRPAARLDGPGARLSQGGRVLEVPGPLHEVAARGGVLLVDGRKLEGGEPLIVRPGSGRLRVDGRPLPGRLEAWADPGGLVLVNALDLEDYVAAVVASEVPRDWPDAALEAQAVAARAHLGSSVLDQVYAGAAHPASGALRAAHATAGEVLTYGAAPIAAYFSASCGGRSETGEDAFNLASGSTPYLISEQDDADPGRAWVVRKPLSEITAELRQAGRVLAEVTSLSISARTGSGRARTLRIDTPSGARTLAAVELRQILGYEALPSLLFEVSVQGDAAVFRGRGNGHGVGLCQWGARARALRGDSYREILAHYYPGSEVRRMY